MVAPEEGSWRVDEVKLHTQPQLQQSATYCMRECQYTEIVRDVILSPLGQLGLRIHHPVLTGLRTSPLQGLTIHGACFLKDEGS